MADTTTNFQWKPEYDDVLQKIASSDDLEGSDWSDLRRVIQHKLEQNVNLFLSTTSGPSPPPPFSSQPSTPGGLRLPPFPPKKLAQMHLYDPPESYMTEDQAKETKEAIFEQLDQFDEKPPFTIQRLCELLLEPKKNYKSVGKYLRAVEKSILVTSAHDAFPSVPLEPTSTFPLPSRANGNGASQDNVQTTAPSSSSSVPSSPLAFATRRSSTPSTPLFSPIPFLHADARSRSKSRSPPPQTPPMTPLSLAGDVTDLPVVPDDEKVIGLVDEMDDPGPGHLSDKPTPLTAAASSDAGKPILKTLQDRFVKTSVEIEGGEDKENEAQDSAKAEEKSGEQGTADASGSRKKAKTDQDEDQHMETAQEEVPKEAKEEKENEGAGDSKMDLDVTEDKSS
ncbi:hypothetical protein CC2G_006060 [Coprinopsis cinerea AmutBmut pab1-1]|nr:hypothetical protein CC2G_006060 [Coprinopsis cinerea AmutBmut pab1-1]